MGDWLCAALAQTKRQRTLWISRQKSLPNHRGTSFVDRACSDRAELNITNMPDSSAISSMAEVDFGLLTSLTHPWDCYEPPSSFRSAWRFSSSPMTTVSASFDNCSNTVASSGPLRRSRDTAATKYRP